MPGEPKVILRIRFWWLLLIVLLAGGIFLYFRNGTQLPVFGSLEPSVETDTTR